MTEQDPRLARIGDLLRANRPEEARAAAQAAIAAGDAPDAILDLAAMLAWRAGDVAAAAAALRSLHARRPDDRAVRLNLGNALAQTGAVAEVEPVLAPLAGDPRADRLRAFAAQQRGDDTAAAALYRTVVAAQPDDADSWNNLGNVCVATRSIEEGIRAFERAITLRPGDPRIYLNLAGLLELGERPSARAKTMRDAARQAPTDPAVQLALGLAEAADNDLDAAEQAFARAIDLAPHDPAAYLELGLILENRNRLADLDTLIALAEEAAIGPELALLQAWSALRGKRVAAAEAIVPRIPETVNAIRRLQIAAQVADRTDRPGDAFALYTRMNDAVVAAAPPAPARSYRAGIAAQSAPVPTAWPPFTPVHGRPQPIFIVGFPRSGTTLLDALLGALPDTYVLEERPLVPTVEGELASGRLPTDPGEAATTALRDRYFELLQVIAPDFDHGRLIDKHPLHMARMPLVHRLFPDAPVLLVERHPYDVVLSCFVANFKLNHAMRSFTSLEEAALTYDAVFTAWEAAAAALPLRLHRVRYERLVTERDRELGALLGFLGIDAAPDTLDHQAAVAARGQVRTASYAQVTEPVYQTSVARWRRYADQLAPVMPILAPWAERMGYETR